MAPQLKMTYFDMTGVGEPIRFLLSYGGIKFEDIRLQEEQWPAIKPSMPFGQIPVLEVDGKKYNQSLSLARYAGKLVGLAGKDDLHALEIDAMADNINDLRIQIDSVYEAEEDVKEKKRGPFENETLPNILGKLDAIAKANNGYFVRGELSWADVTFAALLNYLNFWLQFDMVAKYPNLQRVRDNVLAVPNIKAWVAKRPKTKW